MFKIIVLSIISFIVGYICKGVKIKKLRYRKVQPLSKQNFKKAMKNLEIK